MNVIDTVAALANTYTSAKDMAEKLADQPFMAARRLQEAVFAQACAETIVMLTDSADWRTRARTAKAERENILFSTSQLVSKGHKSNEFVATASREGGPVRTLTIPVDERDPHRANLD